MRGWGGWTADTAGTDTSAAHTTAPPPAWGHAPRVPGPSCRTPRTSSSGDDGTGDQDGDQGRALSAEARRSRRGGAGAADGPGKGAWTGVESGARGTRRHRRGHTAKSRWRFYSDCRNCKCLKQGMLAVGVS